MTTRPPSTRAPTVLTIAGSDSGGGAGIQADLKVFMALGVHGASVVTALTAQNSLGVISVHIPPPEFIMDQFRAVMPDLAPSAAKIGMLGNAAAARAVADALDRWPIDDLVLDPVMISTAGARLLTPDAVDLIRRELIPRARLVTPNLAEAWALLAAAGEGSAPGTPSPSEIKTEADMLRAAEGLMKMGARAVLLKGGHLAGPESPDLLLDASGPRWFRTPRVDSPHTHGSGCALSAAVVAGLARGMNLPDAVGSAKRFITGGIKAAYPVGAGPGPLNHAWAFPAPNATGAPSA